MIEQLPVYIIILFAFTAIATLLLFYWAMRHSPDALTVRRSNTILLCLTAWLLIQAALALKGVYSANLKAFPPKIFVLGIAPALLTIVLLFSLSGGRKFIDSLPLQQLTFLNGVRIPVEIVLLLLYMNGVVPKGMTFEGGNFDILSGTSALFVGYCAFRSGTLNRKWLLGWNIVCLALVVNIFIRALLSTPLPFQKLAFDQPNIAIFYFPFVWLPAFVVPVVLLDHLVSIRRLLRAK